VFAVSNNLLILSEGTSDKVITYGVRENWHNAKLKIDREKFLMAIKWMKFKGIIPEGGGELVEVKGSK
jgi:hypothetical protein